MSYWLKAGFCAAFVLLAGSVWANSAEVPDGLSAGEWASIQGQIVQAQYHAHESETGFSASNQAHGFNVAFGEDGSTLVNAGAADIGFRLISDSPKPQSITAESNTVTYQWSDNLREWWVNDESGLEQWFEVAERSTDNQLLTISVELQTALNVSLANNQLLFSDENTRLTYDKLIAWDATGSELPSHMSLAGAQLTLHVDDSAAQYPITIDPTLSQQAYVKASNTNSSDEFGYAIGLDDDTLVVGARGESSSATGVNGDENDNSTAASGAAYVFTRIGNSWTQQAYLKASNTQNNDQFGWSVAVEGDTVVVGAPSEDSNATGINGDQSNNLMDGSGAAYVFTRNGTTWNQQAYIKASNPGSSDFFGWSVAIDGDTIVVGAPDEDSNATGVGGNQLNNSAGRSGAAYVFIRSGTLWSQEAYLKASNTDRNDLFGRSVDVHAGSIVVGALGEDSNAVGVGGDQTDNSAPDSGASYIFTRSGTVWSQQAYLKASNTDTGDNFGSSTGVDDDTVVVGAYREDSNAVGVNGNQSDNSWTETGAAYVFTRSGSAWSQQAYLKASNTGNLDFFGYSVAVSADAVVVGAALEDSNATGVGGNQTNNSATSSGAAYLFTRTGTTWSQEAYLKASNTGFGDQFAWAVAVDGDTAVASSESEDSNAVGVNGNQTNNSALEAGAAYIFAPGSLRRIIVTGN